MTCLARSNHVALREVSCISLVACLSGVLFQDNVIKRFLSCLKISRKGIHLKAWLCRQARLVTIEKDYRRDRFTVDRIRLISLILGSCAIVALGVFVHSDLVAPPQAAVLQTSRAVLNAEVGMNPRVPQQLTQLTRFLVPGSQAQFLTTWLWQQTARGDTLSGLKPVFTHIAMQSQQIDALSSTRAVVDYRITVTRQFYPRGRQTSQEIATFWLENTQGQWRVYGVSFNFDPIDLPGRPDSLGYDTWHLNPAPAPPHGI